MAFIDRREPKLTGEEPLVITTGEIEKIGNALPLTVAANRFVQAADRNEISGKNTSSQESSSNKFLERENVTSQDLNPENIFTGPKKTGKNEMNNHNEQTPGKQQRRVISGGKDPPPPPKKNTPQKDRVDTTVTISEGVFNSTRRIKRVLGEMNQHINPPSAVNMITRETNHKQNSDDDIFVDANEKKLTQSQNACPDHEFMVITDIAAEATASTTTGTPQRNMTKGETSETQLNAQNFGKTELEIGIEIPEIFSQTRLTE